MSGHGYTWAGVLAPLLSICNPRGSFFPPCLNLHFLVSEMGAYLPGPQDSPPAKSIKWWSSVLRLLVLTKMSECKFLPVPERQCGFVKWLAHNAGEWRGPWLDRHAWETNISGSPACVSKQKNKANWMKTVLEVDAKSDFFSYLWVEFCPHTPKKQKKQKKPTTF